MIWPAALAALLLISIGLFSHFHARSAALATLPVNLETDLIATHDRCCAQPNHQHLKVPRNDDIAIADTLHDRLHRPVLVCHPNDDAWLFRGAAICAVGSTPSGHLVFAKGAGNLSIFSLPKSLMPNAIDGNQYSATLDQHCIVAFVKDDALFCMVGSGDVKVEDLKQMESTMQPQVAAMSAPQNSKVILAELLQPNDH